MEEKKRNLQNILQNPQKAKKTITDLEMQIMTLEIQIEKNFQKLENAKSKKELILDTGKLLQSGLKHLEENESNKEDFKIIENLKYFFENKKKLEMLRNMLGSSLKRIFRICRRS